MIFCDETHFWSYQNFIPDGNSAHIQKRTGVIDEDIFPNGNELTEIGIKRCKYCCGFVNFYSNNFA